jgi:hypothetical protein
MAILLARGAAFREILLGELVRTGQRSDPFLDFIFSPAHSVVTQTFMPREPARTFHPEY